MSIAVGQMLEITTAAVEPRGETKTQPVPAADSVETITPDEDAELAVLEMLSALPVAEAQDGTQTNITMVAEAEAAAAAAAVTATEAAAAAEAAENAAAAKKAEDDMAARLPKKKKKADAAAAARRREETRRGEAAAVAAAKAADDAAALAQAAAQLAENAVAAKAAEEAAVMQLAQEEAAEAAAQAAAAAAAVQRAEDEEAASLLRAEEVRLGGAKSLQQALRALVEAEALRHEHEEQLRRESHEAALREAREAQIIAECLERGETAARTAADFAEKRLAVRMLDRRYAAAIMIQAHARASSTRAGMRAREEASRDIQRVQRGRNGRRIVRQKSQVQQMLMWVGGSHSVEAERVRFLRAVPGEQTDGRPVWETVDEGRRRYIYYQQKANQWIISPKLAPSTAHFATIEADSSGLLPVGKSSNWQMGMYMHKATRGKTVSGELTLIFGTKAEMERASRRHSASPKARGYSPCSPRSLLSPRANTRSPLRAPSAPSSNAALEARIGQLMGLATTQHQQLVAKRAKLASVDLQLHNIMVISPQKAVSTPSTSLTAPFPDVTTVYDSLRKEVKEDGKTRHTASEDVLQSWMARCIQLVAGQVVQLVDLDTRLTVRDEQVSALEQHVSSLRSTLTL